ncbi:MAG: thioredoxin family protein [Planctomycetales bacterium]|nr:thioredoxin family protein [Planctomycetales bacterium]
MSQRLVSSGFTGMLIAMAVSMTASSVAAQLAATTVADALAASQETGRPLLAIASSPTCPPCLALKHTMATSSLVQVELQRYVLLQMDSASSEFTHFRQQFPADYQGVPMVYVIRADGTMLYGRSGGMAEQTLQRLLSAATQRSGSPLSDGQRQHVERSMQAARREVQSGQILSALQRVDSVARIPSYARSVNEARRLQQQLTMSVRNELQVLDEQIEQPDLTHSAAFQLARFYVRSKDLPEVREDAGRLLVKYERHTPTRVAVLQGKELVRAHFEEQRDACQQAITRYRRIVELDAASPTAKHAERRISELIEKQRRKQASAGHSKVQS